LVWQKAVELALPIYRLTEGFPETGDIWIDISGSASRCFCGRLTSPRVTDEVAEESIFSFFQSRRAL